jgi:hypothetical protein
LFCFFFSIFNLYILQLFYNNESIFILNEIKTIQDDCYNGELKIVDDCNDNGEEEDDCQDTETTTTTTTKSKNTTTINYNDEDNNGKQLNKFKIGLQIFYFFICIFRSN